MDRTTQDGIWYQLLGDMEKYDNKVSREWIKKLINKVCKQLGVTREALGIFAGARATMYFDGKWSSVRYDDVEELAGNGTDILFIEKMAIVEVLTEYANKYGVAIVSSSGFLTEYGKDLMNAAERSGGNVAILTDYDDHGLLIVATLLKEGIQIARIGIDEKTLHHFGLSCDKLAIASKKFLKDYDFLAHFDNDTVDKEFVKYRRVEIDAVLAEVGSERLWGYIKEKLIDFAPARDYNRVISMPANETLYPKIVQDLLVYLHSSVEGKLKNAHKKIEDSLANVTGMIDVIEKNKEIQKELENNVSNGEGMKLIVSKVDELLKGLPKLEKEDDDEEG